jgi:signal transduction histidine kinase
LVEQLLALARSEPQQTLGELGPIDLAAAAALGVADSHAMAVDRRIDLGFDSVPGLIVRGDQESLRTLVRNLVDNAVRYAPPGGSVRVRCSRTGQLALLEVIDNGPGIPPADRARVFDRFYRRAAVQEGGSGLGLAIVKAIAERHGAQVALEEAAGGGLRVAVNLPLILRMA